MAAMLSRIKEAVKPVPVLGPVARFLYRAATSPLRLPGSWNRAKGLLRQLPALGPVLRFLHKAVRFPTRLARSRVPQPVIVEKEPTMTRVTSQIASQEQMESKVCTDWIDLMKLRHSMHRKLWEYAYIMQALLEAGCLAPGRRGLGFGVGREPLAAVMATRGCSIVATDLWPEEARNKGWVDTAQYALDVKELNPEGICDDEAFARLVSYCHVDMREIPEDLAGFDFVWSSCALEHLGSLRRGLDFIRESLKCLRPGGVAVHTTEFNLSSDDFTVAHGPVVVFRRGDIERLAGELLAEGHKIVLNFTGGDGPLDHYVDLPPYRQDPGYIRLLYENFEMTSIGLIITKKP